MNEKFFDRWRDVALIIVIAGVAIALFVNQFRDCDVIVGIVMPGNLSMVNESYPRINIQYACMQVCIESFKSESVKLNLCFEQCNQLGDYDDS